jgi:hypothetical protein
LTGAEARSSATGTSKLGDGGNLRARGTSLIGLHYERENEWKLLWKNDQKKLTIAGSITKIISV